MKRDIEAIRNVIITAIAAALLAFVVWTLAAADGRTSPPELPTSTAPAPWGTPSTPIAPYPPPGDPYPAPYPPPPSDPYPAQIYLPFTAGENYP